MKVPCPCCSGKLYAECCEPFHNGQEPPSALLLMRSRYSAYVLQKPDYLQKTTHPKSPHFQPDKAEWTRAILEFCKMTEFVKLEILAFGEDWVSFAAHFRQGGKPVTRLERSHFETVASHWRYVSSEISFH